MNVSDVLSVSGLLADYRAGLLSPSQVAGQVLRLIADGPDAIWITRVKDQTLLDAAGLLDNADRDMPLYGVPFAVKDNIDVASLPTTAGCPGFARPASQTAPVVQRLLDSGAMLIGKTDMDQFATGLVGTRTPYGALSCVAHPAHISGGSSSLRAAVQELGELGVIERRLGIGGTLLR